MDARTTKTRLGGLFAAAVLAAGCSEVVGPAPAHSEPVVLASIGAAAAPVVPPGIVLDQQNGALGYTGQLIRKGFDPMNPRLGDAVIATFYWFGSINIIDSVTDVLTDVNFTPVGNKYTLVEYVTAGGISMATYVATNVQNFPGADSNSYRLAVQANLREPIVDGGVKISAWSGVNAVSAYALGEHRSASGSGSTPVVARPGAIAIGAGALAYAVTMADAVVPLNPPTGFASIGGSGSDAFIKEDGQYAVSAAVGTIDPQWTWDFQAPSTWLATVLALNPPLHLAFTVQPKTTLPLLTMPAVEVAVLDARGNRVTTFSGPVAISIGQNGGVLAPGTLSGTKTVTVVNGIATFSDLSIDQPGNGYTLVVNGAALAGAASAPFNIGAF